MALGASARGNVGQVRAPRGRGGAGPERGSWDTRGACPWRSTGPSARNLSRSAGGTVCRNWLKLPGAGAETLGNGIGGGVQDQLLSREIDRRRGPSPRRPFLGVFDWPLSKDWLFWLGAIAAVRGLGARPAGLVGGGRDVAGRGAGRPADRRHRGPARTDRPPLRRRLRTPRRGGRPCRPALGGATRIGHLTQRRWAYAPGR